MIDEEDHHLIPESACSECGYVTDRCSEVDIDGGAAPEPGDVSLCIRCAAISVFNNDLSLRKPTPAEEEIILKEETVIRAQSAIRFSNLKRGGHTMQ